MMLITADRVLTDAGYLNDGAVLVEKGVITAVGPREQLAEQAGPSAEQHAFSGTLMPGLIDAHVHLIFDAGGDPVSALGESSDTELAEAMAARAAQLLASGVTTARDLGDRNGLALRLAAEIASGSTPGPRIVSAGTPITQPGGHCHFLGGEVAGVDEIRALVKRNAEAGAGVIKVMAGGGGLTKGGPASWQSQFSAEELTALVKEARSVGLPVAAHAHGTDAIAAAVEAGVDTIEHCTWMTSEGFDLREDVLAKIIDQGTAVCPAVSPHWQMLPKFFGVDRAEQMFALVKAMADAGVKLIAGTDAGVQRAGFDGLVGALGFYDHLGLSNARIIAMATVDAAEALGLSEVTGRIAPGLHADLLVVDGDPLADLGALKAVTAVVADGRLHAADQ